MLSVHVHYNKKILDTFYKMTKPTQPAPPTSQKNMPLTDQALSYLRDAIQTRKIKPGQGIDFAVIAKKLGMSRTPIRESIRQLLTEGLLELLPGGTVCVTQLSAKETEGFYYVRDKLEIVAARAAAVHITDLEIEMLKANLSLFDSARAEPEKLSQIDNQFHTVLYDACNNNYLSQTLARLRVKIGLLQGLPFNNPERISDAYNEHAAIIKALESHHPDSAESAVAKHYSNARISRLSLL
ncbi:MAG: GntR family transcriptional regulator [Gammaproteobacteria bacterium]|nr:GntR family transcriptional regulator [Gammaproteobacteria bacterium]MDG2339376.1 GntR family transcriptional regulator [Gammaproteobacteria bacterium]